MNSFVSRVHHWNRSRKWDLFESSCLTPSVSVLDVGFSAKDGTTSYENYLEIEIDHLERVTGLTIEPIPDVNPFPGLTIVRYDGGTFPFNDNDFDVCWSNAVLEHVGDDAAKVRFLAEIKRVSERAFVTTPNRYFPVEPHTRVPLLHLLPKRVFDAILRRIGKAWATGAYMDLLGRRRLESLLREAGIVDYQLHCNRIGPFTMDFVVIY